jgi:hypothetical protein
VSGCALVWECRDRTKSNAQSEQESGRSCSGVLRVGESGGRNSGGGGGVMAVAVVAVVENGGEGGGGGVADGGGSGGPGGERGGSDGSGGDGGGQAVKELAAKEMTWAHARSHIDIVCSCASMMA